MKIVFVCTGNTCRSPMAEVLARDIFKKAGIDAIVSSRGLNVMVNSAVTPNAAACAKEAGLDLSGHSVRQITIEDIENADIILTMTKAHKDALKDICRKLGKRVETLGAFVGRGEVSILDPFGGDMDIYRKCFAQLKECIEEIPHVISK